MDAPPLAAAEYPRFFIADSNGFPDKERWGFVRSMQEWKDVEEESLAVDRWVDIDSNRQYDVLYVRAEPYHASDNPQDDEAFFEQEVTTIGGFLQNMVDDLPPDTYSIILSPRGQLLWSRSDPDPALHEVQEGYKPSLHQYGLPRPLPTLLRSQLTLVDRLYRHVDKVTYPDSRWDEPEKTVIFKYTGHYCTVWREIQTLARLPAHHPHMIGIDCIVLEELTGLGVIGFTTRFIDAPSMYQWPPSRPFKLRYLRELMGVLDELHLQHGIHHRDIHDRNLLVDPATDKLVLIDFGLVGSPGGGGYHSEWNDFKATVILLHYRITRGTRYDGNYPPSDEEEASLLLSREKWVKHPDAVLDHSADVFYDELVAWLKKRGHWHQIIQPAQEEPASQLSLPPSPPPRPINFPAFPMDHFVQLKDLDPSDHSGCFDLCRVSARVRREFGRPILTWHRPTKAKVDPTRRLLATGRYADEEEAVSGRAIAVPDPKLGFPQPPVFPPTPTPTPAAAAAGPAPSRPRKTWKRKRVSGSSRLVSEDI